MNHIKYMAARVINDEELKLNMNAYIRQEFPESFCIAEQVCGHLGKQLNKEFPEIEVGYLAMHIARVYAEETK